MHKATRIVAIVLAVVVLAIPFSASPFLTDLLFRTALLGIIAVSWNMMASAGLISLGHSAFWGMGAYTAILVANKLGLGFLPSLVCATLAGALLGAGLALITGRLQGIYFAICTLAVSEGLRVIAVMLPDLTGGAQGQYLNAKLVPATLYIDLAGSIGLVFVGWLAWYISTTRYQYAFRAMRANEHAAQMLGIRPLVYRIFIVTLSGGMASFAGGASAWYGGYLDPSIAFSLHTTIMAQIAPILGGIYTLSGPLLGTLLATLLGEVTRTALGSIEGAALLVYGIALVLCVIFLPQGFKGAVDDWMRRRRKATAARAAPAATKEEAS
ncbi:MAG TPA: branched-chain amino acid ABC transporter permease [Burkholderiaceae bacterium]|nr:branched-chain amino acid ABC transporter permease [Burkholderiaceae bacterium]HQR75262.1 branched-chain amino acid ABC transporter permease [Burkholderiaceae bacterium]